MNNQLILSQSARLQLLTPNLELSFSIKISGSFVHPSICLANFFLHQL